MRPGPVSCLLIVLLLAAVGSAQLERHDMSYGSSLQRGGHSRFGRLFHGRPGANHRDKRACTWWFEWRVNGANVNNEYVTNLLNKFFKNVCAKFS